MIYKGQTVLAVVKSKAIGHTGFLNDPGQLPELSHSAKQRLWQKPFRPQKIPFLSLSKPEDTFKSPPLPHRVRLYCPEAGSRAPPCLPGKKTGNSPYPARRWG